MKITKEQLRTIIKEEKAKIQEAALSGTDMMKMQLVDEIVDLLVENGAVNSNQRGYDTGNYDDDVYQDALDYLRGAIIPALRDLASRGAYDRK